MTKNIYGSLYEAGDLAERCLKIPIGENSSGITIPTVDETSRATGSRWGGIRAYWEGEADEITSSKPKFRKLKLEPKKLVGLCYATDELIQDAPALETFLELGFTEEIKFKVVDAIVNGTGSGMPQGILTSSCLVAVAKESGQLADTVVSENILNMWQRMPSRNRKTAVWLINQDCEKELATMSIDVGTGGVPVYMPAGGLTGQPYTSLFTRPVIPLEQAATLGDKGDIILFDPASYLLCDKGNPKFQGSMHVRFIYGEMAYRIVYRVDGAPLLNSAITQFKGANTMSTCVTLAAR